ncbi:hypothetical protein BT63DRAFT_419522 [Microthyrium microscopicum]|uniref:X8 domain-containing protein n=1 Tax=Microthyrium microscopicum TaxID=703497 RepID=A0A6A6US34_9PEZI|nr:hypothetical protein BT63DRAFT_419522 [Microthyrium microscopicum]
MFNSTDLWDYSTFKKYCKNPYDDNLCKAVDNNYTTGVYGTYDGCTAQEQSSWILSQLYISKGRDPASCTSAGGIMKTPVAASSRQADCQSYLKQAGPDSVGKITATPAPVQEQRPANGDELKPATKAGIGVGISIFALICIAVGFVLYRRRQNSTGSEEEDLGFEKAELDGSEVGAAKTQPQSDIPPDSAELDSGERHEMATDVPHELETPVTGSETTAIPHEIDSREIAELEGSLAGHEMKQETVEKLVNRGYMGPLSPVIE